MDNDLISRQIKLYSKELGLKIEWNVVYDQDCVTVNLFNKHSRVELTLSPKATSVRVTKALIAALDMMDNVSDGWVV